MGIEFPLVMEKDEALEQGKIVQGFIFYAKIQQMRIADIPQGSAKADKILTLIKSKKGRDLVILNCKIKFDK